MSKRMTAKMLRNLPQNRGRPLEELEKLARRINRGTDDAQLRRLFGLAVLTPLLDGYADGDIPGSLFLQFVQEGPKRLAQQGQRMLDKMEPERKRRFLDRLIEDENARIERSDAAYPEPRKGKGRRPREKALRQVE